MGSNLIAVAQSRISIGCVGCRTKIIYDNVKSKFSSRIFLITVRNSSPRQNKESGVVFVTAMSLWVWLAGLAVVVSSSSSSSCSETCGPSQTLCRYFCRTGGLQPGQADVSDLLSAPQVNIPIR